MQHGVELVTYRFELERGIGQVGGQAAVVRRGGCVAAGVQPEASAFGGLVEGAPGDGVVQLAVQRQPPAEHAGHERVTRWPRRQARIRGPQVVGDVAGPGQPAARHGLPEQPVGRGITGRVDVGGRADPGVVGVHGERRGRGVIGEPPLGARDLGQVQSQPAERRRDRDRQIPALGQQREVAGQRAGVGPVPASAPGQPVEQRPVERIAATAGWHPAVPSSSASMPSTALPADICQLNR